MTVDKKSKEPRFTPVAFHDACISRIQIALGETLIKRSRAQYSSPDKSVMVNCAVSKEHTPIRRQITGSYSTLIKKESLQSATKSYVAFGCGTSKRVLLIPFTDFDSWLRGMWTTQKGDRYYWHVVIYRKGDTIPCIVRRVKKDKSYALCFGVICLTKASTGRLTATDDA